MMLMMAMTMMRMTMTTMNDAAAADRLQVAVVLTAGERHGDGSGARGDIGTASRSSTSVTSSHFKRRRLVLSSTCFRPTFLEPAAFQHTSHRVTQLCVRGKVENSV